MLRFLAILLLLCAGVTGYGQGAVIDTIYTENLACGGESFKLLWMPFYGTPEDEWANSLQNLLDASGFEGANLIDYSYADLESENCWCWYNPIYYEDHPNAGAHCNCCWGAAIRPFVDYLVVSYSTNPCTYLDAVISSAICSGCTDPSALNFDAFAINDDGTCLYGQDTCGQGTIWEESSQTCVIDEAYCSWQPDSDGDQLIGVSDLLMFLSVFGDTDLDQDGIFDSNDDCVGEYDECGVCNGNGPSIPIVESIEILYDSLYAEQIDEWWVFEVGVDTTFTMVCEVIEGCTDSSAVNFMMEANVDDGSCWLGCGSPINFWEHHYETVFADGKCWFAEDLQTTRYADGSEIPSAEGSEWLNTSEGLQYNNMYNGYAVNDDRGLCPTGWHVSTVSEWHSILSDYGPYSQQNSCCGYYYGIAQHFKHSSWDGGLNTSGLSVKPNGYMNPNGTFVGGSQATFGTPTYHAPNFNDNGQNQVTMGQTQVLAGQAIRCIKDTE